MNISNIATIPEKDDRLKLCKGAEKLISSYHRKILILFFAYMIFAFVLFFAVS